MTTRYWLEFWLNNGAAWFLTYLLYSTWLFGATALLVRLGRAAAATENALWRLAVAIAPVLATLRILVEHAAAPVAAGPDALSIRGTAGWSLIYACVGALLVALWLTCRLGFAAWSERGRLASRQPVRDPRLLEEMRALAIAAGCPVPRLTESDRLRAPVAIGRREICIPSAVFQRLSRLGARAVLAHELAHLARRDTWWTTGAHVLDRVFFPQPLQRWAGRRMRETAEFLADEFAVRLSPGPEHLVDALTTFARTSRRRVAVSGFAPGSLLLRRVERVLSGPAHDGRARSLALLALLALATIGVWFSPAVVPACDCLLRR